MIESSMNINDEVLQKELSQTSNEKMKNIVATIQKEQNAIIRNEHSHELIIQGVAGSGKTSVALHRVAFLLYRNKGTLTYQNIWIISPNKVFSDYISNILPELGEEKMLEIGIEEIAAKELKGVSKFLSFSQQVSELAASDDPSLIERIQWKSGVPVDCQLQMKIPHYLHSNFPHYRQFICLNIAPRRGQVTGKLHLFGFIINRLCPKETSFFLFFDTITFPLNVDGMGVMQ